MTKSIVPDPMLWVILWKHLRGSSPDNLFTENFQISGRGQTLRKSFKDYFFVVITHSERHYHVYFVNEISFVPSCRHQDWIEQEYIFKKIRDTKGTFHAKMGSIKDRNCMDLREAEDIKNRWQEYTEELYKKDLHNPDNHEGVITDLEPDILECEVKWP